MTLNHLNISHKIRSRLLSSGPQRAFRGSSPGGPPWVRSEKRALGTGSEGATPRGKLTSYSLFLLRIYSFFLTVVLLFCCSIVVHSYLHPLYIVDCQHQYWCFTFYTNLNSIHMLKACLAPQYFRAMAHGRAV